MQKIIEEPIKKDELILYDDPILYRDILKKTL